MFLIFSGVLSSLCIFKQKVQPKSLYSIQVISASLFQSI